MKKTISLLLLLSVIFMPVKAQDVENVKPVKNVILLIPDGTSLATVSMARWLQWYTNPDKPKLNIDPYLCGTVRTHSSNAPIGDSAPTTSCYMTGQPSRTGYVSTYPENDGDNDIYPTDPARAFQPLTTVLEAAKIKQGKSTGLVFTCEFPHATPADCSAHSYNRGKYEWIAPQMAHNDLNVVIGGGASLLPEESEAYLKGNGYGIFKNDIDGMRNYKANISVAMPTGSFAWAAQSTLLPSTIRKKPFGFWDNFSIALRVISSKDGCWLGSRSMS